MSFTKIFYGGASSPGSYNGIVYAITFDGRLIWHKDTNRRGQNGPNGSTGWAPGSGTKQIGIGWNNFKHVFSGGDGIIYAIKPTGELLWYRDTDLKGNNGPNAERGWAPGSGKQIGFGWNNFKHVFSGGDGILYAVTPDGNLLWYRDDYRNGNNGKKAERGWATGSGNPIHSGWDRFIHICAVAGTIYAVTDAGGLIWFQDDNRQGQNGPLGLTGWAANSGKQIGVGWNVFSHVISGGTSSDIVFGKPDGNILYALVQPAPLIGGKITGKLLWYRDFNRLGGNAADGSSGWSTGSGNPIDKGW